MAFGLVRFEGVERYIKSYAEYILRQAKQRLKSKDVTGQLSSSLYYNFYKTEKGYVIEFKSSAVGKDGKPFADYVQKGVKGTEGTRTYINIKGERKTTDYSFKRGKENAPPPSSLYDWIKARGLKGRDRGYTKADGTKVKGSGRFITDNSLAFAISKGIQKKGVPAASFYTQPISWSFNLFKEELQKELKIDVLKYITE